MTFLSIIANQVWVLWMLSWIFRGLATPLGVASDNLVVRMCVQITKELRPFAMPGLIVGYILGALTVHYSIMDHVWFVLNVVNTYILLKMTKDDDDRWKRRRKKLTEKVRQAGARLVVDPT